MSEIFTQTLRVSTQGKGLYELTDGLRGALAQSGLSEGLLTIFCRHTSASLIITENADPTARADVCDFLERMVPEGGDYAHTLEGMDDATSHIKSVLTRTSESIPFEKGRLCLGIWQGVFLWEHRHRAHSREVVLNFIGRR